MYTWGRVKHKYPGVAGAAFQIITTRPFAPFPLPKRPPTSAIMTSADVEGQLKDASSKEIEDASLHENVSFTPEEEKALVKKIDLTLLPTIWVMYLLSYLDRTK